MLGRVAGVLGIERADLGAALAPLGPGPGVAEPEVGQEVERGRVGAAVLGGDRHEHVARGALGVLDGDVEVAALGEGPEIGELHLGVGRAGGGRALHQLGIGIAALGILVRPAQVGRGRCGVLVVVDLLHVLAVVALRARHAEEALLEDLVLLVPQREGEAEDLAPVAEPGEAVLAPAVGAAPRVVVGEVAPRVALGAVVLPHGAPRALGDVGPPVPPAHDALAILGHAAVLGGREGALRHERDARRAARRRRGAPARRPRHQFARFTRCA